MKKIFRILLLLIILVGASYLVPHTMNEREEVNLVHVIDGDTAIFRNHEGIEKHYRFLYIDTPEDTNEKEPYGSEATAFTKACLEEAKHIEIQYQEGNDSYDKYGRELVWVFVDGQLLQEKIAKAGYVKSFYDNGNVYDYKQAILDANQEAKRAQIGIYTIK